MEIAGLGPEGSRQLQQAIKEKLSQLNAYTDDVLPDYIMVLYGNGYAPAKIIDDLEAFLGLTVARQFTEWLFAHVQQMQQPVSTVNTERRPSNSVRDEPTPSGMVMMMEVDMPSFSQGRRSEDRRDPLQREDDLRGTLDRHQRTGRSRNMAADQRGMGDQRGGAEHPDDRDARDGHDRPAHNRADRYYHRSPRRRSFSPPPPTERRVIRRSDRRPQQEVSPPPLLHRPHPADGLLEDARSLLVRQPRQQRGRDYRGLQMDREDGAAAFKPPSGQAGKQQVRCAYWPNCRLGDEACPFVHPQDPCRFFPSCQHGDQCLFVHPSIPCKFGLGCANPLCNYQHPASLQAPLGAGAGTQATLLCRFHPRCANVNCPFLHPVDTPCKFGEACRKPACPFTHPAGHALQLAKAMVNAPCKYGKQCIRPDCAYQHPEGQSPMLAKLVVSPTEMMQAEPTTNTGGEDESKTAVEMSSSIPPSPQPAPSS